MGFFWATYGVFLSKLWGFLNKLWVFFEHDPLRYPLSLVFVLLWLPELMGHGSHFAPCLFLSLVGISLVPDLYFVVWAFAVSVPLFVVVGFRLPYLCFTDRSTSFRSALIHASTMFCWPSFFLRIHLHLLIFFCHIQLLLIFMCDSLLCQPFHSWFIWLWCSNRSIRLNTFLCRLRASAPAHLPVWHLQILRCRSARCCVLNNWYLMTVLIWCYWFYWYSAKCCQSKPFLA